jgi:hypothetical protein
MDGIRGDQAIFALQLACHDMRQEPQATYHQAKQQQRKRSGQTLYG